MTYPDKGYMIYKDGIIMCKEKKCTNCKFFNTYEETRFPSDSIGFCTRYFISDEKSRRHIAENVGCDMWELGESNRKAELKYIELVLRDVQEKLTRIAQILQEENR